MSGYTLRFSEQAKEDIRQHKKLGNKSVVNKIILLLEERVYPKFCVWVDFHQGRILCRSKSPIC